MTLDWQQHPEPQCKVTACGRYSVSVWRGQWSAWKLAPGGPWFAPLKQRLSSEDEAKRVAQDDADKTP